MHELNALSINKLIENMEAMWIRTIASTQLKMESEYSGRRLIGDERTSEIKKRTEPRNDLCGRLSQSFVRNF